MALISMYSPIWERLKSHKTAVIKFPEDELNVGLAIRRTKKAVIRLKDSDTGFKATSDMVYRLEIRVDLKARTLAFKLTPCIKRTIACQI